MTLNDSHLLETQIDGELVYDGIMLKVHRDTVRLPNGAESVREYVRHPGAVVVIALLDSGKMLFERQFRYPVGQIFLELPAGKIDPGEEVLVTAQRELLEETGHIAEHWRHLATMHPCIGYSDERIEIFLARDLRDTGKNNLDHNEFLELLELSSEEASASIREGQITDAKTITALYWAEKVLREGW